MAAGSASTALASYLKADSAVNTITAGRVWRPALADTEGVNMPRENVVIRRAGGYSLFSGGMVPTGDPRLDIFCYGSTWLSAEQLAEAVVVALRKLTQSVHAGTRLLWARIEGGPMPVEDPQTNFPTVVVTCQLAYSEIAIS